MEHINNEITLLKERRSSPVTGDFLLQIPSETTCAERAFLFQHFQCDWRGDGVVIEIGPFLGGTTRAIAAGMLSNPHRCADTKLYTIDRFREYYDPERLRHFIEPLVRSGMMESAAADILVRKGSFLEVFRAIHSSWDYYSLIEVVDQALPDNPAPNEFSGAHSFAFVRHDTPVSALFVDGCKSWYATAYAMRKVLPRMSVGSSVIFQDFGHYTCFWISSFADAAREFLTFSRSIDSTYAFTLRCPVSESCVTAIFPDTFEEFTADRFVESSARLAKVSRERRDLRGMLIAQLHLVAALAALGKKRTAQVILKGIDRDLYADASLARLIQGSQHSPTYLPGIGPLRW